MTRADISQKDAKATAEWRTRGIAGKVVAVNPQTNQILVEMGGMMNATKITITPKPDAKYLRYADDSVKFADAKASSITAIKMGDQIRAVGDKSADGSAFTAEKILSGTFRQTSGTILSLDAAKNEAVIKDIATNKNVTIAFGEAIMLKRFPAEMAERMASFQTPGAARPPGPGQGSTPAGQQPINGQPQPGGPGRVMGGPRGGGGIDDMLERMPNITATDLKVGEMIAILTSGAQASVDRVKAIKLIAGIEPFVKMAQAATAQAGRGQAGGNQPGLNIPGLDGIGVP
jgi:ribosomal protein L24